MRKRTLILSLIIFVCFCALTISPSLSKPANAECTDCMYLPYYTCYEWAGCNDEEGCDCTFIHCPWTYVDSDAQEDEYCCGGDVVVPSGYYKICCDHDLYDWWLVFC